MRPVNRMTRAPGVGETHCTTSPSCRTFGREQPLVAPTSPVMVAEKKTLTGVETAAALVTERMGAALWVVSAQEPSASRPVRVPATELQVAESLGTW